MNVDWAARRAEALALLGQAEELQRIVSLVGPEALSGEQRWTLESANLIKEAVLQQSALDEADSFASPEKQFALLDLVLQVYHRGAGLLKRGVPVQQLMTVPVLSQARRLKSRFNSEQVEDMRGFSGAIKDAFDKLGAEYEQQGEKTP